MSYSLRLLDGLLDEVLAELPAVLLVGPRSVGKTTTAARRAASIVRLDVPSEAGAFRADPDAMLRSMPAPVLLDEWQAVPETMSAVKRAVDGDFRPGRFVLTGSASGDLIGATAAGTGRVVRLRLYGMSVREQEGNSEQTPFLDRLARGEAIESPSQSWDIRDYLDAAMKSGFPEAAGLTSPHARQRWLEGYIDQVVTRDASGGPGMRDPVRLRRYLEGYALNSAGVVEAQSIYTAAGVDKKTASAYESLLENLFVVEALPAWLSNRMKRLTRAPKRHVVDAGLLAAALGMEYRAVLTDAGILGRVIESFVVSQLRSELEVCRSRPRLFHLRESQGRREIDLVAELGGRGVVACEVKAGASVGPGDARHLAWFRDLLGERFVAGVVLHTGPRAFHVGEKIQALPISTIWS